MGKKLIVYKIVSSKAICLLKKPLIQPYEYLVWPGLMIYKKYWSTWARDATSLCVIYKVKIEDAGSARLDSDNKFGREFEREFESVDFGFDFELVTKTSRFSWTLKTAFSSAQAPLSVGGSTVSPYLRGVGRQVACPIFE